MINPLRLARQLQAEVHREGFRWPDGTGYVAKIREEVDEVEAELGRGDRDPASDDGLTVEIGDLVLAVVALCSSVGVDPEHALELAARKFHDRYRFVARERHGRDVGGASAETLELWRRAKREAARSPVAPPTTVAVIGRWDEDDPDVLADAESVGRLVAREGAVVFSGGGPGVMEAACRGAQGSGATTVGLLGTDDATTEANDYLDVPIPTGMGWDVRSALLVRSVDVLVLIGGANGSLQEITMGYMKRRTIVVLEGSGGLADRLRAFCLDGLFLDERRNVALTYVDRPEGVVDVLRSRGPRIVPEDAPEGVAEGAAAGAGHRPDVTRADVPGASGLRERDRGYPRAP